MSSSSFELLKPICENVMLSANKNNVEHLNKFLSEVPDTILQQYQNAIIFPIEFQLHQVSNTEVQQKLIECLITLFKRTYITSLEIFIHISRVLYERISSGKGEVVLKKVPEELKLSVVECIIALITRTEHSVLYEIYSRERYHLMSPLIFICTLLAKEEKLVKLRFKR
uniref:TTI1 N-terminal TPR domain-containing protein n=1 Tax=Clastoptera arizonana TaxID=38151 RepID=A0A1B6CP44_9HEMI